MDEMTVFGLIYAAGMALMILQLGALVWVVYDVLTKQKKMPDLEKVLWIVVAFLFTIIGALIYYVLIKREHKYEEKPGEEDSSEDTPQVY